jgi:hypothetical protein
VKRVWLPLVVALSGCISGQTFDTMQDLARHACMLFAADNAAQLAPEVGLDPAALAEDVAELYCDNADHVRPFVDSLVAAEQSAADEAGIAR